MKDPHTPKRGDVIWLRFDPQAGHEQAEVMLPSGLPINGAVLSDQIKSVDWRARDARVICSLPEAVVNGILQRAALLLALG